jgi:hypothetical protein
MNLMKFSRMDLAECATSEVLLTVLIDEGGLALDTDITAIEALRRIKGGVLMFPDCSSDHPD